MQTIDRTDFNEPISPSLERRVLSTIISICESYLEQYPTSVDDDEKLTQDRALFSSFNRQQRMAIKLRVSEKVILRQTIGAVKEELNRLPAVVVGDRIVAAGRSFDNRALVKGEKIGMSTFVDIREDEKKKKAAASESSEVGQGEESKVSLAERRRKRRSG